jgi:phosphatidate cytidylyltransferase
LGLVFAAFAVAAHTQILPFTLLVASACLLWGVLFLFTLTDRVNFLHRTRFKLPMGILLLLAASTIVIRLHQLENGPWWILCFFLCVWAADIGAYFVGRRFGKTKLAPSISPGKTVEGLLGGVALAAVIFVPVVAYNFDFGPALLLLATILATVLVSVMGDLFESKMKRHVGLKDSGQILPGHGGVLDRIDGLLAGAPFFALGLVLLGYAA